MDAFEQLVSEILWMEGYWVRTAVKVELTKEDKKAIGRATSPRWEIDVVGYRGRDNVVQVVECKSFLDSHGVRVSSFEGERDRKKDRYKLFNEPETRRVVFARLAQQLFDCGACREAPDVRLALACGKIREPDREGLRTNFQRNGWELWDETWLRDRLRRMAARGYENQVSAVVAKLLLRGAVV